LFDSCHRRRSAYIRSRRRQRRVSWKSRGEVSIAKEIASEKSIDHRFCEPNKKERSDIGSKNFSEIALGLAMTERLSDEELNCKARAIEIGRYFPIRERFWLTRLDGCRDVDGIFICGDLHVESFGRLLKQEGIQYRVVERGIGRNEQDEPYYRAMQYFIEHPELSSE
jgi:hypothetical protein